MKWVLPKSLGILGCSQVTDMTARTQVQWLKSKLAIFFSFDSFEFGFGRISFFLRWVPRLPSSSFDRATRPTRFHHYSQRNPSGIRSVRPSPVIADGSNRSIHQNSIFGLISSKWPLNTIKLKLFSTNGSLCYPLKLIHTSFTIFPR